MMTSLTLPFRHTSMYDEYVLYFFFRLLREYKLGQVLQEI